MRNFHAMPGTTNFSSQVLGTLDTGADGPGHLLELAPGGAVLSSVRYSAQNPKKVLKARTAQGILARAGRP